MCGGRELALGGPKEQRVLAVLAAAALGHSVTVDELVEALWADHPPRHGGTQRARCTSPGCGARSSRPARRRPPRVHPDRGPRSTAWCSTRTHSTPAPSSDSRTAPATISTPVTHSERACRSLDDAFAMEIRGTPFDEHLDVVRCAQESRRLDEILRRADRRPHPWPDWSSVTRAGLVPELETLVVQSPWRERLWGSSHSRCTRAGRQADALGTLQRARTACRWRSSASTRVPSCVTSRRRSSSRTLRCSPLHRAPDLRHAGCRRCSIPAVRCSSGGPRALAPERSVGTRLRGTWRVRGRGRRRRRREDAPRRRTGGERLRERRTRPPCTLRRRRPWPGGTARSSAARRRRGARGHRQRARGTPGEALARFLASWSAGRPVLLRARRPPPRRHGHGGCPRRTCRVVRRACPSPGRRHLPLRGRRRRHGAGDLVVLRPLTRPTTCATRSPRSIGRGGATTRSTSSSR